MELRAPLQTRGLGRSEQVPGVCALTRIQVVYARPLRKTTAFESPASPESASSTLSVFLLLPLPPASSARLRDPFSSGRLVQTPWQQGDGQEDRRLCICLCCVFLRLWMIPAHHLHSIQCTWSGDARLVNT